METTVEKVYRGGHMPALCTLYRRKTVRVAVYARVSTDKEIQLNSLAEQMKAFQAKIAANPGWMLTEIYADEGISGTGVKKRKEFLRMIQDCEAGKIDYIVTKSISRFARNTVECLSYVRYLQSIGVQLYFEKEGIDTAAAVSEMLLTVMAAFAQEESRSISENLKWGLRKRFAEGTARWANTYGYRIENGEIIREPQEARTVRKIFRLYQHGVSIPDILQELAHTQTPTAKGKAAWNKTALKYLLQNEKYMGDMCLQKWVSVDHISHKSVPNDATVVPSYYVKNHHVPIIDRHTFRQVQRIMELKAPRSEYSRYPYYDTDFVCPLCGEKMTPKVMKANTHRRIIGCFGEDGCQNYAVKCYLVDAALLHAYNTLETKAENTTTAMKRLLSIKKDAPTLQAVHYYWLDDLVERIEFEADDLHVFWKCGLESKTTLQTPKAENPAHIAELYRNALQRAENRPDKPAPTKKRAAKKGEKAVDY